jgi:hypothetical protein
LVSGGDSGLLIETARAWDLGRSVIGVIATAIRNFTRWEANTSGRVPGLFTPSFGFESFGCAVGLLALGTVRTGDSSLRRPSLASGGESDLAGMRSHVVDLDALLFRFGQCPLLHWTSL